MNYQILQGNVSIVLPELPKASFACHLPMRKTSVD